MGGIFWLNIATRSISARLIPRHGQRLQPQILPLQNWDEEEGDPLMMKYLKKNWKDDALGLAGAIVILLVALALSTTCE